MDDCDDCLYLLVSGHMRTEPRAKPAAAPTPATAAPADAPPSSLGLARPPPPSRRPPPLSYVPVPLEGEVIISLDEVQTSRDEVQTNGGGAPGAAGTAGGGQPAAATLLSTAMERGTTFGEMALLYTRRRTVSAHYP